MLRVRRGENSAAAGRAGSGLRVVRPHCCFRAFLSFLVERRDSAAAAAAAAVRTEAAPVSPTQHFRPNLHNKSQILYNQGERGYISITSATFYARMRLFMTFMECLVFSGKLRGISVVCAFISTGNGS